MSFIQLSAITPTPDTITAPSLVELAFTLSAAKGTPTAVYYQLNSDDNIYFQLTNGSLVKELVQLVTMPADTKTFKDKVLIQKVAVPPGQDHQFGFIYVQAVNKLNDLSAIKHCMINFV
ncbi:hypothetical protein PQ469_24255 [Mucilaginibacter sp. KACC 22773]|uniref:hypothetical protein n=1 Tax=Mucilaginibacter sp. KACC 22773 TaxID=3025671 RepID=UPI0023662421|nr:hypothetical protein [Mucilaginibacter sp. KACC 22773]WDF77000.1 hypothetical protein PQ469_24255 [Mucilaginibacter sp. KACC 22773]